MYSIHRMSPLEKIPAPNDECPENWDARTNTPSYTSVELKYWNDNAPRKIKDEES